MGKCMVGGRPGKRLGVRAGEGGVGGSCGVFSTSLEGRVDELHAPTDGSLLEQAVVFSSVSMCGILPAAVVDFGSLWSHLVGLWSCSCGFWSCLVGLGFLELSIVEAMQ